MPFDQRCLICAQEAKKDQLCDFCRLELPWNATACRQCALPLPTANSPKNNDCDPICPECQADPPPFDESISVFRLETPIIALHHQYKFQRNTALGRWLAHRVEETLPTDDLPDCIVPVPLHWRRQLTRGFNQATGLIRPFADVHDVRLESSHIKRLHSTPAQSGLDKKQRQRNLRGAFRISGNWENQDVVIFDDIVTTTSTTREIARLLTSSGASRIRVWSLARAPRFEP